MKVNVWHNCDDSMSYEPPRPGQRGHTKYEMYGILEAFVLRQYIDLPEIMGRTLFGHEYQPTRCFPGVPQYVRANCPIWKMRR